jgi:hypothetical protein
VKASSGSWHGELDVLLIYGIWSLALDIGEFLVSKLEARSSKLEAIEVCDLGMLGCTLKATYAQQIMLISKSNNAQDISHAILRIATLKSLGFKANTYQCVAHICRPLSFTVCLKPRLVDELSG